jgi:glutamine---fructose-6-phosphate transaminase (isomerizing)
MDPRGFLLDVERVPDTLAGLADALEDGRLPLDAVRPAQVEQVLLLAMGSSAYAAGVVAARLRAAGVHAVAELASSPLLPPPAPGMLVLAVSAGGSSAETVGAAARYAGRAMLVAVTDVPGSALAEAADDVLPLLAGIEVGGVACRSYRHTLAVLLAVAERLAPGCAPGIPAACRTAAGSTAALLAGRDGWLPAAAELLAGPDGVWVVAPADRLASAQQSALMMREGPRVPAHACETGDWSHVDVYLTATLDYRMLLMPGSAWDGELLGWTARRHSTVVSVGAAVGGGQLDVGFPMALDRDVAMLTETTVGELVAHRWWVT